MDYGEVVNVVLPSVDGSLEEFYSLYFSYINYNFMIFKNKEDECLKCKTMAHKYRTKGCPFLQMGLRKGCSKSQGWLTTMGAA